MWNSFNSNLKSVGSLFLNYFHLFSKGGGILIGEIIVDDDKRGPWQGMIYSILMLSVCTNAHWKRSGKEYEEMLTKHGFVDVQYRQNAVLFFPGGVFARKP